MSEQEIQFEPMDTSDCDKYVGKPIGGPQLKEPMSVDDIRRWVQGMHNPNPLYYDEKFAEESVFGQIVAPLSFAVNCTYGHGAMPAVQGKIPGMHMIFGGDEWWFFGPRILPGDKLWSERLCYDYKVTNTKFAGPTMFMRGDTTYINQRGEMVARQRATSIRYLVVNADKLNFMPTLGKQPEWTEEDLERIEDEKIAYYKTFQKHILRKFDDIKEEETLPTGIVGPHTYLTLATEWRAFKFTVWGTSLDEGTLPNTSFGGGWLPEMSFDFEKARINPALADGLYVGPSRGHAQTKYADIISIHRAYGYGASMGAYVLDYVSNWAGELGCIEHANIQYRTPTFAGVIPNHGDVTYLNGKVAKKQIEPVSGKGIVTVDFEMTNQDKLVLALSTLEVQLPLE